MSETYLLQYQTQVGSRLQEVTEGPYSLDEVLKRRLEVSEAGFLDWKVKLEEPKR